MVEAHAEEGGANLRPVENGPDAEPGLGYLGSLMGNIDGDVSVERLTQRVLDDRSGGAYIGQATDEGRGFENSDNIGADLHDSNSTSNDQNNEEHNDNRSIDNDDSFPSSMIPLLITQAVKITTIIPPTVNDDDPSNSEDGDDDSNNSDEKSSDSDNDEPSPDTGDNNAPFNRRVDDVGSSSRDDPCQGKQLKKKRGNNENEDDTIQNKKARHDIGKRMELRPRHKN
ncbi:hypothetical protein BDA99DRAFT_539492 [Phascolomyces articulosus]|uniref:Uncharacterized protein n=1 Tax=Phascolomyces articulosus TaxID=60185 RepID=A0AAD5K6V4_9FUNG|nr:hypothetical protein BDA99DRAFT_539492 [Phascolomyces articulosus]